MSQTWDSKLNTIRGKNLVFDTAITQQDVWTLFEFIDIVTDALEEADYEDKFGTEGWRHSILGED